MAFYVYDQPVAGRGHYYGRELVVRSLNDGIHRGRSFALIGGPRTGRTSTLRHVTHQVHEKWTRQPSASKVAPVSIDLTEAKKGDPRLFIIQLWESTVAALGDPLIGGRDARPPPPKLNLLRSPDPWGDYINALQEMFEALQGTSSWCQYALLVDNADLFFERRFESFLGPVAELVSTQEDWAPAAVILGGGRLLREHLLDDEGAFARLRPMFLGALRDSEAEGLIRAGLKKVDDSYVEALMSASGKHPYVLQRILSELERTGIDKGLDAAIDAAADDCLELFAQVWQEFDMGRGVTYRGAYAAPEHALMQLIVDFATGIDLKTAERELGITPLKEFADFLEYMGVAERSLKSDLTFYRPQCDLWNIWYSERIMQ